MSIPTDTLGPLCRSLLAGDLRFCLSKWGDIACKQAPTGGAQQLARSYTAVALLLSRSALRHLFICALLPALILSADAAAALHDPGDKLAYVRLEKLPGDATALIAAWPAPALIVDLRRAAGDAPENMEDDLPLRPRLEPVFALVSSATPAGALEFLRDRAPGLITLGSAATEPKPDLPIAVSPEADRRSYDAFNAGVSLDSLLDDNISKPRFDEAALLAGRVREHANGGGTEAEGSGSNAESQAAPEAPAPAEGKNPDSSISNSQTTPPPAAPEAPPVDGVLQRAVQLHRALIALGRLPRS